MLLTTTETLELHMLTHYPEKSLGQEDHGWLKAKHHFSFARYYNPKRMGFGKLRVVNDDLVAAGSGFPPHPHNNMEIITYVRSGEIVHEDSTGNKGVTKAGDVQVMSAGKGIVHSEYNLSDTPLTLYQIWIESNVKNVAPRWETKPFPNESVTNTLPLVVSGFKEDKGKALPIYQQARIYAGRIKKGVEILHHITNQVYVLASRGQFSLVDKATSTELMMQQGDGAEIVDTQHVTIKALSDCEMLIIDVPDQ